MPLTAQHAGPEPEGVPLHAGGCEVKHDDRVNNDLGQAMTDGRVDEPQSVSTQPQAFTASSSAEEVADEATVAVDDAGSSRTSPEQEAKKVNEQGAPELIQAVTSGGLAVSVAAKIAKQPKSSQAAALELARGKKAKAGPGGKKNQKKKPTAPTPRETPGPPPATPEGPAPAMVVEVVADHPGEAPPDDRVGEDAPDQEFVKEPLGPSKVDRFADARSLIDDTVFDVLDEIREGHDLASFDRLAAKASRATAALLKVAEYFGKARSGDWTRSLST